MTCRYSFSRNAAKSVYVYKADTNARRRAGQAILLTVSNKEFNYGATSNRAAE